MTVLNRSPFALTDLVGDVSWSDESGALLAMTTSVSLRGTIASGAIVSFRSGQGCDPSCITTSGKIGGKGAPKHVTFTHATIIAGSN